MFVSPFSPHPVHSLLKSAFNSIAIEKEKLKQMVSEQDHNKGHSTQMARLRQSLSQVNESVCFTLVMHSLPRNARLGVEVVRHAWHVQLKLPPRHCNVRIKF